jgi:long-chain acyl-CoA synthetase
MNYQTFPQHGILDYFMKWEKTIPTAVFLRQPKGPKWKEYSWKEVGEEARRIVSHLKSLGLPAGTRIALLSQNCAEWIICDLALLMGGYISVPLYTNEKADTLKEILIHSESRLLFVGKLYQKDWNNLRSAIPASVIAITMRGYERESITPWEKFINSENQDTEIILPSLDDILTIIYTSGTTGRPKGVVHSYGSIIKAIEACLESVMLNRPGNRFFSYLPLSHAAERGLVEFGAIFSGGSISFLDFPETFSANIRNVLPTHFFAVPRIWEKFQIKILKRISQKHIDILLKIPLVAFLFRQYIKRTLGLQEAKVIFSGAAPISSDLILWFAKFGIQIQEAYGMSENFNVCSINPKDKIRIGTVGKLYEHEDIKIDPQTHEITQRCEWLMKGYYKDPELTSVTIRNGYLHTGDTGEFSGDGYLTLTGRIKDVFKTSKGEYITPVKTELHFLSMKEVDQACLLGQKYPQPFLLVVLSEFGKNLNRHRLIKGLTAALDFCNNKSMRYQKIKKVIVVKEEWTSENNLLTPTLKMKRNELSWKYEAQMQDVYNLDELVSFE